MLTQVSRQGIDTRRAPTRGRFGLVGLVAAGVAGLSLGCDALSEPPAPPAANTAFGPATPTFDTPRRTTKLPPAPDLSELPPEIREDCKFILEAEQQGDSFGFETAPIGGRESPLLAAPTVPERRAKPISGGTLLVTQDKRFAVAADPDRDAVYVVNLETNAVEHTVTLAQDAEPGRVVEDSHGQVHVMLRGAGDVLTLDPQSGEHEQRQACSIGRGIDYRASDDSLFVACMEGMLVRMPARSDADEPVLTAQLPVGARDVVINGIDHVLVSMFRSAEVLDLGLDPMSVVDMDGVVRWTPGDGRYASTSSAAPCRIQRFESTVAFRTLRAPDGAVAMVHERSKLGPVETAPGSEGYGGGGDFVLCGSSIVQSTLTLKRPGEPPRSAVVRGAVLPVDVAFSPNGGQVALVMPGNQLSDHPQLQVMDTTRFRDHAIDPNETMVSDHNADMGCVSDALQDVGVAPDLPGELTSVAFVQANVMLIQSREPAMLMRVEHSVPEGRVVKATVTLSDQSVQDTGHMLFHANAGAGIACASCHPDGMDDGHTWEFAELGPRRTQHLRGGLLGSEPFHWQGDMNTFQALYDEVFVGRMGGFVARPEEVQAVATWIDALPAYHMPAKDLTAVARGEQIFQSSEAGCSGCHAGAQLRINESRDVGTGQPFQVPSLSGIAFHAPYMHDGCASSLVDRFGECGGAAHGDTSHLDDQDVSDLIAYLETL